VIPDERVDEQPKVRARQVNSPPCTPDLLSSSPRDDRHGHKPPTLLGFAVTVNATAGACGYGTGNVASRAIRSTSSICRRSLEAVPARRSENRATDRVELARPSGLAVLLHGAAQVANLFVAREHGVRVEVDGATRLLARVVHV